MDPAQVTIPGAELIEKILLGVGPAGTLVIVIAWLYLKNQRENAKRASGESPDRRNLTPLIEKVLDVDRHVRASREEVEEVAETARALAKTTERLEDAVGRTHDICVETKAILAAVNSRLDRLEERL